LLLRPRAKRRGRHGHGCFNRRQFEFDIAIRDRVFVNLDVGSLRFAEALRGNGHRVNSGRQTFDLELALLVCDRRISLVRSAFGDRHRGAHHDRAFGIGNLSFDAPAGAVNADQWQGRQENADDNQRTGKSLVFHIPLTAPGNWKCRDFGDSAALIDRIIRVQ